MTKLKIYSQNKAQKINEHHLMTVEAYNITNGVKSDNLWYSEVSTDNYNLTRIELEKAGYTAHPSSVKEIESRIYTVFQETV